MRFQVDDRLGRGETRLEVVLDERGEVARVSDTVLCNASDLRVLTGEGRAWRESIERTHAWISRLLLR